MVFLVLSETEENLIKNLVFFLNTKNTKNFFENIDVFNAKKSQLKNI